MPEPSDPLASTTASAASAAFAPAQPSGAEGQRSPCTGRAEGDQTPLFGYTLMGLGRQWRSVVHLRLAELGLTDATWVPLFHLHAAGEGISLKALAQRVGLESSTLVRVVDLLEDRGWVRRETDQQDRRSKLLWVTPAGHAVVADVRAKLVQVEGRLLDGMDAATVQQLLHAMLQLQQRMAQELAGALPPPDDAVVMAQGDAQGTTQRQGQGDAPVDVPMFRPRAARRTTTQEP